MTAIEQFDLSQCGACALVGGDPKTLRRERRPDCLHTRARMRAIASERRRFGCRRIGLTLERARITINYKKLRRLYAEEGLAVKRKRGRKRATGERAPRVPALPPNDRWSLDCLSDVFDPGRRFRILAVIGDSTHDNLAVVVDTSISGARVIASV